MLQFKADQIQAILKTLKKITEYYKVSELKLNLKKCEIAMNCNNADIENVIQETGMERVSTLKHRGVHLEIKETSHMTKISCS